MDALIILFASGILTMFISLLKKPVLSLITASAGLFIAGSLLVLNFDHPLNFIKYEGLIFDSASVLFSLTIVVFTLLLTLSGYAYFSKEKDHTGDYMALMLFSATGALCMVSFSDLFMFFIGLEILSIPVYVLAGTKKKDLRSTEASIKYFFTGAFATGVLLFGIAMIYGATGTFKIAEIEAFINTNDTLPSFLHVGILLMLASFLFKVGAVPFHFWSPDVYEGSPSVMTGYMAAVVKFAGFIAFFKLFSVAFGGASDYWAPILIVVAIASMFLGNLSAIQQTQFKRLIAYSSITHVGYALLAILSFNSLLNVQSLWIYLFSYGFSIVVLLSVSMLIKQEDDSIASLKGLARKYPFIGFVAILALLSMAGIPPLFGFFGKYMVFSRAFGAYPMLVIIAIINSGIGIYYYLRTIIVMLSENDQESMIKTPHVLHYLVLSICAIALMVGGFVFV